MSELKFDLSKLSGNRLGFVAPPFPAGGAPDPMSLVPIKKLDGLFDRKSQLGVELRMPIALAIPGKPKVQLPNEPVISIEGSVMMKKTILNRGKRKGTVKEIINLDDYRINIQGTIYNEEDYFPEEQIGAIREVLEYPGPIEIYCLATRIHNITMAVRVRHSWPRSEGDPFRLQHYSIELESDEDFEIELI